ncbi:MAG TPA: glutathione peroxidase [Pyrinomonadaceae bacterium]|nr:glutathione peroxidase [Pyrinomonadaceae bacterium]
MLKIILVLVAVGAAGLVAAAYKYGFIFNPSPAEPVKEKRMYEFTMKDIDGNDVSLEKYKGNVVMLVNVASRCGLTPQYEGLQEIYEKYKDRGFTVLGFPANNFLGQEPGTEAEIKEFCSLNYNVGFPMFSKISVKGADQHPLYRFLTHPETNPGFDGDITWNFEKFLADRDGKIIARFSPRTVPTEPEVIEKLEAALAK